MAENAYIDIEGAPGEGTVKGYQKWIPLKSVSWEVSRTVDMEDLSTTQRGFANSSFGKISVTSEMGLQSPKLMLSVADGTVRKKTVIHLTRSGATASKGMEPYCIITLSDSVIDKYEVSGGEEQIPEENWDLAYRKIEWEYKKADPTSGELSKGSDFSWDLLAGEMA